MRGGGPDKQVFNMAPNSCQDRYIKDGTLRFRLRP
jgi:hypothetical protein